MKIAKSLVVLGVLTAFTPTGASAQAAAKWQDMELVDLAKDPLPEGLSNWSQMVQANNTKFAQVRTLKTKTGNSPALIRFAVLRNGEETIVASIFHGIAANCESGANSFASTQTWAMCPAQIAVTSHGQTKILRTRACFNGFPLGDTKPAPSDQRSEVRYDQSQGRVFFRALTRGAAPAECNVSVKIN